MCTVGHLFPVSMLHKTELFQRLSMHFELRHPLQELPQFQDMVDVVVSAIRLFRSSGLRLKMLLRLAYRSAKTINRAYRQYLLRRNIALQAVLTAWRRTDPLEMSIQMECVAIAYTKRRLGFKERWRCWRALERQRRLARQREEGAWMVHVAEGDDTLKGGLKRAFHELRCLDTAPLQPPELGFTPRTVSTAVLAETYVELRDAYRTQRVLQTFAAARGCGGGGGGGAAEPAVKTVPYFYRGEESRSGFRVLVEDVRLVWTTDRRVYYAAAMQKHAAAAAAAAAAAKGKGKGKAKQRAVSLAAQALESPGRSEGAGDEGEREGAGAGRAGEEEGGDDAASGGEDGDGARRVAQKFARRLHGSVHQRRRENGQGVRFSDGGDGRGALAKFADADAAAAAAAAAAEAEAEEAEARKIVDGYGSERHEQHRKTLVSLGVLRAQPGDAEFGKANVYIDRDFRFCPSEDSEGSQEGGPAEAEDAGAAKVPLRILSPRTRRRLRGGVCRSQLAVFQRRPAAVAPSRQWSPGGPTLRLDEPPPHALRRTKARLVRPGSAPATCGFAAGTAPVAAAAAAHGRPAALAATAPAPTLATASAGSLPAAVEEDSLSASASVSVRAAATTPPAAVSAHRRNKRLTAAALYVETIERAEDAAQQTADCALQRLKAVGASKGPVGAAATGHGAAGAGRGSGGGSSAAAARGGAARRGKGAAEAAPLSDALRLLYRLHGEQQPYRAETILVPRRNAYKKAAGGGPFYAADWVGHG